MADNDEKLYALKYTTNLQMQLQQEQSKLRGTVDEGSYSGAKQAQVVDTLGSIEMQQNTTKYADIVPQEIDNDQRWVDPTMWDLAQYCDHFDKLKSAVDLQSGKVRASAAAINRKIDDIIIAAFFGTAKTGENGNTSTVFGVAQYISVNEGGVGSGLNVDKLLAAEQMVLEDEIDLDYDSLYCMINPKQHRRLKEEIEMVSGDFNRTYSLDQSGMLKKWGNFNFIVSNKVPTGTDDQSVGTATYMVPVWVKSGMHLGIWEGPTTKISQIDTKRGMPWQIYNQMYLGATRLDEKKVVKIWCV